jgi:YD repeat-containing protein
MSSGNVQTVQDGAGDTTQYVYDPMDRAVVVTDPDTHRVGTVYDLAGQVLFTFHAWNSAAGPTDCTAAHKPVYPQDAPSWSYGPSNKKWFMLFNVNYSGMLRPSNISRAIIHETLHSGDRPNTIGYLLWEEAGGHAL